MLLKSAHLFNIYIAQNTKISPNLLLSKFCGSAQFPQQITAFYIHCLFVFNNGSPTWTGRQPGYSHFITVSKLRQVIACSMVIALLSDRRDLYDFSKLQDLLSYYSNVFF